MLVLPSSPISVNSMPTCSLTVGRLEPNFTLSCEVFVVLFFLFTFSTVLFSLSWPLLDVERADVHRPLPRNEKVDRIVACNVERLLSFQSSSVPSLPSAPGFFLEQKSGMKGSLVSFVAFKHTRYARSAIMMNSVPLWITFIMKTMRAFSPSDTNLPCFNPTEHPCSKSQITDATPSSRRKRLKRCRALILLLLLSVLAPVVVLEFIELSRSKSLKPQYRMNRAKMNRKRTTTPLPMAINSKLSVPSLTALANLNRVKSAMVAYIFLFVCFTLITFCCIPFSWSSHQ
mmetsp:Transcript_1587/g.2887  ORF Transcript_1587/g.2887 Transcript_1587/m.2887 type:complete len:287 (+) Transcript_1587:197-1057(+)